MGKAKKQLASNDSERAAASAALDKQMAQMIKEMIERSKQAWTQSQSFLDQGKQWQQVAKNELSALKGKQDMLDQAVNRQNQLYGRASDETVGAANTLRDATENLVQNTYGTSAEDFFNRTLNAGNRQGNEMAANAANVAQNQAQQAARGAGLSKSAAAASGAGSAASAAQGTYLQGMLAGQNQFATGTANVFDANNRANQQNYEASLNNADAFRQQGQAGVSGAETGLSAQQQTYRNTADQQQAANDNAANFGNMSINAGAEEGGKVTHKKGVINIKRGE